ncbi:MAG: TetR/AcrR family transcriptional regulator [Cyclobacteriaceae bacterium]|nr:TetR/AcrR family transcriptional regulator [Cyclobacteriaceae bacterium]
MAYKEFALHSYEGASITRLVGELKMAKGSIYQYFEDKEDLYNYLVENAQNKLLEVINKTSPPPTYDDPFNKWLERFVIIQAKFFLAIPSYALLISRYQSDFKEKDPLVLIKTKIKDASELTGKKISIEDNYLLQHLPLQIFNFIIHSEKIELDEIINSNSSIEIPNNKLLYLCEAFLRKP